MTIDIKRSGNLIAFDADDELVKLLDKTLSYNHRTFYQGPELLERKRLKGIGRLDGSPHFEVVKCELYSVQDGQLICGAGLKSRLTQALDCFNLVWTYADLRKNSLPEADYSRLLRLDELDFRFGQEDALALIDSAEGGVIKAPTAFGKTFLMVLICIIYPKCSIAFISPGKDLLRSTYSRLMKVVPGEVGRVGDGNAEYDKRIILCSADSLHKISMQKTQLVIYDEVHTAGTERRSANLCRTYTDAKFIGFTASPNSRADGADRVIESIFGPIILDIAYEDAVAAGTVSAINTQFVEIPKSVVSPTPVGESWRRKRDGYHRNIERNRAIARICDDFIPEYLGLEDPQILVMCESVEHIFELRQFMPEYEAMYANVSPKLKSQLTNRGLWKNEFHLNEDLIDEMIEEGLWKEDKSNTGLITKLREEGRWQNGDYMSPGKRANLLKQFESGKLRKVIANHCWKQGIDPIHLDALVRVDGGTSTINNIQLPGRLSRIDGGKHTGLLVDILDSWDVKWALPRSAKRKTAYKKGGFNILETIQV